MYEQYVHPRQREGLWKLLVLFLGTEVRGIDFISRLARTNNLTRAYSPQDQLIKGWMEHPETYPEELKRRVVLLFGGSREGRDDTGRVAWLGWTGGQVVIFGDDLERTWFKRERVVALLKKTN